MSAGTPPISVVVAPGVQGATGVGVQAPGVSTPSAAEVWLAVIGFARLLQSPNGVMFTKGLKSTMVAAGFDSTSTRLSGNTTRLPGMIPNEQVSGAPVVTGNGTAATVPDASIGGCLTVEVPSDEPWRDLGRALVVHHLGPSATSDDEDPGGRVPDEVLDPVRQRFEMSLGEADPFAIVAANAALPLGAAEVLAVVMTAELDPEVARLLATVRPSRPRLTIGDVRRIGGDRGVRWLGPDGPLRRSALVEVVPDGAFVDHLVTVHPVVLWAMLGDGSVDPDLPPGAEDIDVDDPPDADADLVVVTGDDRVLRWRTGARYARGGRFVAVMAPGDEAGWAAVVRDATLTGRGVVIEVGERLGAIGRRWIERADHLAWVVSSRSGTAIDDLPDRPWTEVVAGSREVDDREWAAALGDAPRTHRLTHEQLDLVQRVFPAVGHDLDAAVRRLVSGRMEHLATRIRPSRTWDDIVLSPDRSELLRSLVERYRYADRVYDDWGFSASPSRGLVALFSGPSGTGKTLATEIIAGELGLDVFKLDLSAVVSKYIGETEKNLEQVFDAASAGNLVLFFDEADSLFGKRSEVKDARDRYANIEVSYLLQRLERYDGLVVMATNFEKNVDEAFVRRIHSRIEFVLPGVAERRRIWTANLPATAPVRDVDVDWLAQRFELSGGSIRNAAVHAAFLAAAEASDITMETAVRGVARELRKMGRLLRPLDFGEHYAMVGDVGEP